jgi:hypothetical protein
MPDLTLFTCSFVLQATGQSFLSVAETFGRLVGTLGGSILMQQYGSVVAYRTFAAIVSLSATVYGVTEIFCGLYRTKQSTGSNETRVPVSSAARNVETKTSGFQLEDVGVES